MLTVNVYEENDLFDLEEGDDELISLAALAMRLKLRGILNRHRNTLVRWCEEGVEGSSKRIYLNSQEIANRRHSCVRWVRDFLEEQRES